MQESFICFVHTVSSKVGEKLVIARGIPKSSKTFHTLSLKRLSDKLMPRLCYNVQESTLSFVLPTSTNKTSNKMHPTMYCCRPARSRSMSMFTYFWLVFEGF